MFGKKKCPECGSTKLKRIKFTAYRGTRLLKWVCTSCEYLMTEKGQR